MSLTPFKASSQARICAEKSSNGGSSSRNLKENSFYSKSGRGPEELKVNLQAKLRSRRTTSFASLKDRRKENEGSFGTRLTRKSSKASSRRSLDSPFCSQPSSPDKESHAPNAQIGRSNSKRHRSSALDAQDLLEPEPKRRNSTNRVKRSHPVANHLRSSRTLCPGDAEASGDAQMELNRRPSHPILGLDSGLRRDDLDFLQGGLPAIDFNRPPSQLSIYAPVEAGALTRSDSMTSMTSNDRFAAGLLAASTPYNPKRISNPSGLRSDDSLADRSPWITDSLISPPTIYRRLPLDAENDGGSDSQKRANVATETAQLDTLTSDSDYAHVPSDGVPAQDQLYNQVTGGQDAKGTSSAIDAQKSTSDPRARARSGTIISPKPMVASGRVVGRTRTGTITASTVPVIQKQTRHRSGTITPNSITRPLLEPALPVAGRSRSGTVTAVPRLQSPVEGTVLEPAAGEVLMKDNDAEALVDAVYDPTPVAEMEFSSAPNPDIELDLEDEVLDITLRTANVQSPSALAPSKTSRKMKLPLLSSSTELAGADAMVTLKGTGVAPAKQSRPRSAGNDASSSTSKLSKRMNIKAALGLNLKSSTGPSKEVCSEEKLRGASGQEETLSSSDPLDFLSHYNQDDFNRPYEAPPPPPKKRGRGRGKDAKVFRR
ncbi:hypothetical protein NMY22_g5477 [Coprinellus aureogranulatus]|nr:hypothetical protein NMY22_g5477 [Coprinellus aureogranulatus]